MLPKKVLFTGICLTLLLVVGCSLLPIGDEDQAHEKVTPTISSQSTIEPMDYQPTIVAEPAGLEESTATPLPQAPTENDNTNPFIQPAAPAEGSGYFTVESGTPVFMPAFMHAEKECSWMGVGGQVFDVSGTPLIDLNVLLLGTLNGEEVNLFTLTGTATAFGPGGYEFMLADRPIPSTKSLYVALFDSYGKKLSGDVYFDTSDVCDNNLVLINFREQKSAGKYRIFLPFIVAGGS